MTTKNCCKDCKNGNVGGNPTCQAKLLVEKLHEKKEQEDQTQKIPEDSGLKT